AITVQGLRRVPDIGTLTAERPLGDNKVYALFDKMPPGTVMALTLICRPQDQLSKHVQDVKKASIGDGADAVLARENCTEVGLEMSRGDPLIPVCFNIYVRAEDEKTLRRTVNRVESLLLQNGLQTVGRANDLLPGDAWVRNLPMNYDPTLDRANRRSRLMFASHIARMLPLYGRSRGTGKPGVLFFNRGGNPVTFDPIAERKMNAFLLLLGPPGAGKSATLVCLLLQVLAVTRPRIYIIEAGNSLGLTCDYLESQGLSVHEAVMKPGSDVSLPPFAGALSLLDQEVEVDATLDEDVDDYAHAAEDTPDNKNEKRDLLGEMEIQARIMITGGEALEEAKMSRADRRMIRVAILDAAHTVRARGDEQVLTEDVAKALHRIGEDTAFDERRRERARDMGDGMLLFCDGLAGHFFNRPGTHWPDVDVTHLEMGILAHEGYEDQLSVAYTALMNQINSVVEARQHEARHTIVITDEGHVITTNPLLAPYVVKITKMWRKYGAWYWIATQNFEDFPATAKRMLNMIEWWLCLAMPKEEIDQITKFRALTDEQRSMLLSARKQPGKYTEGVVMNTDMATLFRNVPPGLALALAQTEKDEKAARAAIMRETGCTEV
ncbi:MAG: conjugative transfer ATPase, partial [bacterium]|nr:conjugative transfer ATPase [bacterium]